MKKPLRYRFHLLRAILKLEHNMIVLRIRIVELSKLMVTFCRSHLRIRISSARALFMSLWLQRQISLSN